MSIAWDIGFIEKPKIEDLDGFMQSLGYQIEPPKQRKGAFTRIYTFCDTSVPREIEFFYNEDQTNQERFKKTNKKVESYGNLKTYSTTPTYPCLEDRLKIIEEKGVKNQYDYYKHLAPERLRWYEAALAIKNRFDCIITSEQTGEEINPDKIFP